MIYGKGDHMLDHLSHALYTMPLFAPVGLKEKSVRPVAIQDVVKIIQAALVEGRLSGQTVAVVGPEELKFSQVVRRVAKVIGKSVYTVPMPVIFHYSLAWLCELTMKIPLISLAQVRMLAEGIVEPLSDCAELPADLRPGTFLTEEQIRQGLPEPKSFGLRDCLYFRS
jgi:NADH dehydrogenase